MKRIPLTKGLFAIVDDEDFQIINQFNWQVTSGRCLYARKWVRLGVKNRKNCFMHRLVMGLDFSAFDNRQIDHINHDTLDNRKSNLRICSGLENSRNRRRRQNSKFPYKGLRRKKNQGWIAQIKVENKYVHLGSFKTPKAAAKAYDRAAKKHFGEFAKLNFK